jgi:hypothetical protein
MRGALVTRVLAVVADLGVADALADGPRPVADVARETGADEDLLYRMLRALASDGVFAETEHGVFRNTKRSKLLRRNEPYSDLAHLFGGVWYRAVGELDASGEPPFPRLFGTDFWSWLAEHPGERAAYDRAMEHGKDHRLDSLAGVAWRGDELVVDVGGGNGSLLRGLLERHPGLRGIVFDVPETVRDESVFDDRLAFVPGSFFESVPTGDVYVLSGILVNWDDEHAEAILRTIRAAASDDSRLIAVERAVPPGNEPESAKWLDLLLLAHVGGRERDEAQWRELLGRTGFHLDRIDGDVIEASCR